jgi:hypothetical protein
MAITEIYSKPFRKGPLFLYPLLGINNNAAIKPESGWSSMDGFIAKEDKKFICVYDTSVIGFENFAAKEITSRVNFLERIELDDVLAAFVFDFSIYGNSWDAYLNGKYSKFEDVSKKIILKYHSKNSGNMEYLSSFLYPEKYFDLYAQLLDVDIDLLINVGELCDKPDFEKEKLITNSYSF